MTTSTSEDDSILVLKKDALPKKLFSNAPEKKAKPPAAVEGRTARKITLTMRTRVKRATRCSYWCYRT